MGWQDRPYYRDRSSGSANPLAWLLSGSIPLGTWFGINVRVHAVMVIYVVYTLLSPDSVGGWHNALTSLVILFGIVLLHEFGHCFGSRAVGGDPNEILIYPLGGLAMAGAPHRPWANFVTVLCGPLVNVLICIVTAAAIAILAGSWRAVPWNPLNLELRRLVWTSTPAYYLWWIFDVSYVLLLFNLWPVFPLDGGQMLQSVLWAKFGYYKASIFASVTGMLGAVFFAGFGLTQRSMMIVAIAVSGFLWSFRMYRELKANGPWAYQDEPDYGGASFNISRRKISARKLRKAQRAEREAAAEQERIDAILAKVSAQGMNSLTWWEKRTLHKATQHQRERDLETSRSRRA